MCQIFDFFKTNEGQVIVKNGFEAAGITEAVENARNGVFTDLNLINNLERKLINTSKIMFFYLLLPPIRVNFMPSLLGF